VIRIIKAIAALAALAALAGVLYLVIAVLPPVLVDETALVGPFARSPRPAALEGIAGIAA
jgi:hypothetical protein